MYPNLLNTPGLSLFAHAVDRERQQQLAEFGDQKHRDGTRTSNRDWADHASAACQHAADEDALSWAAVLYEKFTEALAEEDPAALRADLIQVAAVCAAWVRDIDTRPHPMICAHCGKPIPESEHMWTWHGPVPKPGEPNCVVPRYHLGLEYPECRAAGGDDQPAAAAEGAQR